MLPKPVPSLKGFVMEFINDKPDKQLTGLCGEHYVAALLAGYGLVVALPRGGGKL